MLLKITFQEYSHLGEVTYRYWVTVASTGWEGLSPGSPGTTATTSAPRNSSKFTDMSRESLKLTDISRESFPIFHVKVYFKSNCNQCLYVKNANVEQNLI